MTVNTQNTILLGYDPGMGNQKVYGKEGGSTFPSHISMDTGQNTMISNKGMGISVKTKPMEIEIDEVKYFSGITSHFYGQPIENLAYDRLLGSSELSVMFYSVLSKYSKDYSVDLDAPIILAVGLPFELSQGDIAKSNSARIQKFFKGNHSWVADGKRFDIEIEKVLVTNQAVGALFDMQLDDQANSIPQHAHLQKQEIGVVSIGSKTTEIMFLDSLKIVPNMTQGRTFGVSDLLNMANQDGLYTLAMLDEKLRGKRLKLDGILDGWTRNLFGHIHTVWGNKWKRAARILVVGGGSTILNGTIETHFEGKSFRPDDPIQSVARGLYKILVTKFS